jgi:hypothetical protein
MSKRITIIITAFTILTVGMQSCYKVATVVPDNATEVTGPVSFAFDIMPILNASCNSGGCHSTGGHIPDLSADKAYNSLNNGGYLDLSTPENSELYLWLTGKRATEMPPGGPSNPANLNQLVLAWTKQGAQNN